MKNLFKFDPTPLYISTAIFAVLYFLMPKWIYSPIALSDTDPWSQIGFFLNYKLMSYFYYDIHFKEAISTNILGIVFYKIYSPFIANLFLKFLRFLIFGYFIYSTIKYEINKKTAILTLFCSLTLFNFLIAFGTDYTDGWILFYLTAVIYSLFRAYRIQNAKTKWLILSGFFLCLMIGSGFQSINYVFSLFCIFILLEFRETRQFNIKNTYNLLYFFIGFLFCFCVLNIFNYLYIGEFWTCKISIKRTISFVSEIRNDKSMNIFYKNNILFSILILFFSTFIYLKNLFKHRKLTFTFESIILIATYTNIIIMVFLEFIFNQELISNINYFNHILPFIILLYSSYLLQYLSKIYNGNSIEHILILVIIFYFCIIWYMPGYFFISEYYPTKLMSLNRTIPIVYPIIYPKYLYIGILFTLISFFIINNLKKYIIFISFILLVTFINFTPCIYIVKNDTSLQFKNISGKVFLESLVDWFNYSNKINKRRKFFFWFNEKHDTYIKSCLTVSNAKRNVYGIFMPEFQDDIIKRLGNADITVAILASNKNDILIGKKVLEKKFKNISLRGNHIFTSKAFKIFIILCKINNDEEHKNIIH